MQRHTASCLHQQSEVVRIQSKLAEFLLAHEAKEIALQIYDIALDVDEEIDRILRDPQVQSLYEYDGQFFTARDTVSFHTAFDGLHVLKGLRNSTIDTFFRGRTKSIATRWLLDELHIHRWVARRRRINWEETRTLGLVPQKLIQETIDYERARCVGVNPPPLSIEEQAFFKSFEDGIGESDYPVYGHSGT